MLCAAIRQTFHQALTTSNFPDIWYIIMGLISIDILNKNTPSVKNARSSRKHKLVIIHTND